MGDNVVCSGPPTGFKFVYNNYYAEPSTTYIVLPHVTDVISRSIASSSMSSGFSMGAFGPLSQQFRPNALTLPLCLIELPPASSLTSSLREISRSSSFPAHIPVPRARAGPLGSLCCPYRARRSRDSYSSEKWLRSRF
jgi:hypothetical protein